MNLVLAGVLLRGKGEDAVFDSEISKQIIIVGGIINIILWLAIKSERASQSLILYIFERM